MGELVNVILLWANADLCCLALQNLNHARRKRQQEQKAEEVLEMHVDDLFCKGDHVNQYGLPNDGYDYSHHLKEIGVAKMTTTSTEYKVVCAHVHAAVCWNRWWQVP